MLLYVLSPDGPVHEMLCGRADAPGRGTRVPRSHTPARAAVASCVVGRKCHACMLLCLLWLPVAVMVAGSQVQSVATSCQRRLVLYCPTAGDTSGVMHV